MKVNALNTMIPRGFAFQRATSPNRASGKLYAAPKAPLVS